MNSLFAIAGVAGVALAVFLRVFRDILAKDVFPRLSKEHSYRLLRLLSILAWSVALAGIGAWVYMHFIDNQEVRRREEAERARVAAHLSQVAATVDMCGKNLREALKIDSNFDAEDEQDVSAPWLLNQFKDVMSPMLGGVDYIHVKNRLRFTPEVSEQNRVEGKYSVIVSLKNVCHIVGDDQKCFNGLLMSYAHGDASVECSEDHVKIVFLPPSCSGSDVHVSGLNFLICNLVYDKGFMLAGASGDASIKNGDLFVKFKAGVLNSGMPGPTAEHPGVTLRK